MSGGKMVCPDCNGNGVLSKEHKSDLVKKCKKCNNTGEIEITEETMKEFFETIKSSRLQ